MRYDDCHLPVTFLILFCLVSGASATRVEHLLTCEPNISVAAERLGCTCLSTAAQMKLQSSLSLPPWPTATHFIDCTNRNMSELPNFSELNVHKQELIVDLSKNRFSKLDERQRLPQYTNALIIRNFARSSSKIFEPASYGFFFDASYGDRPGTKLTSFKLKLHRYQQLNHLDLSFNDLDSIPVLALRNATGLQSVRLSYNRVSNVPRFAFGFLHNILLIDLCGNKIRDLSADAFARSPGAYAGPLLLDRLDLSYNEIERLPPGVFAYLTNLRILLLQGNRLKALDHPQLWSGLIKLSYLDLAFNRIDNITFRSGDMPRLRNLSLSNNRLGRLRPCHFSTLTSLQSLQLATNNIDSIGHCVFHNMSSLTWLVLDMNERLQRLNCCSLLELKSRSVSMRGSSLTCDCSFYAYTHFPPFVIRYNGQECRQYKNLPNLLNRNNKRICYESYEMLLRLCENHDCNLQCWPNATIQTGASATTHFTPLLLGFILFYFLLNDGGEMNFDAL